jgi:acetyltransferase-like isoleucine patch superfamily enzyme
MRSTYPFVSLGSNLYVHYRCDLRRAIARYIEIGDSVRLDRDIWFNIPVTPVQKDPVIQIGDRCRLGRRSVLSAINRIHIEQDVVFEPNVLIMDHNHAFEDVTLPIRRQGVSRGGRIRIEKGCHIAYGAAIVCGSGELVVGRSSRISPNAVVTRSVPPNSVVAGNPARVVEQVDTFQNEYALAAVTELATALGQKL